MGRRRAEMGRDVFADAMEDFLDEAGEDENDFPGHNWVLSRPLDVRLLLRLAPPPVHISLYSRYTCMLRLPDW